jgi:hypothetical protein
MAKENEIPVISFAEDAALSGGYWLALAGDEIFVDQNTFIGSIGALSANFGLVDAAKKLGKYVSLYYYDVHLINYSILTIIVHSTKFLSSDWSRAVQLIINCTP